MGDHGPAHKVGTLLVVRMTFTLEKFFILYIREIIQLHGVLVSIESHGELERTIQTLEDTLQSCILDLKGS